MKEARPKPSFTEVALKSKGAMVIGGGGGDFINGIPIVNYLRLLGVEKIYIGGFGCQWLYNLRSPYHYAPAPCVFSIDQLENVERIADTFALISKTSKIETEIYSGPLVEAIIGDAFNLPSFIVTMDKGVTGAVRGLNEAIRKLGIDLIVGVECGGDALCTGKEAKILTPLHDAIMVATLASMDIPSFLALTGYAADGELSVEELERAWSEIARDGGYLGAIGITQKDVRDLERAWEVSILYDPIDVCVLHAAKGAIHEQRTLRGRSVKLNPLMAVILFLDPKVVLKHGIAKELIDTSSLREAEERLLAMGIYPETRCRNPSEPVWEPHPKVDRKWIHRSSE
ncbi:MAG: hypothetical protein DRN64_01140 [Thaumarchaeota archaeon]|nr:MAG: hypothetical protein DRN64_01140 [Nitrososphaerota archaeon]